MIILFDVQEPDIYFKSSENMEELEDNSIQLILTSPPYGKIKNYGGSEEQIGYYDSFEEYFLRLTNVWKECYRVLEPQCRLIINIGDQYLRTAQYGRYRILPIFSRIINSAISLGFDFLGDIIWQKISTTNTTGGCSLMGSIYYPRNGLLTFDYEHILIFKKHEGKGRTIDHQRKELSKISLSEWKKWYIGHWKFPGIVQKEHIAMFPEELPYRIIRMFSLIGDVILDPFVGSGTTLKVAKALFRKGIGYEINESYKNTIEAKVKEGNIGYFKDYQFLLFSIFQKAMNRHFKISFKKQKQKGILILESNNGTELILDYMLINSGASNTDSILRDLEIKLEENTLQNYLKGKEGWGKFTKYIIVVNSHTYSENKRIKKCFNNYIEEIRLPKKIEIFSYEEFISEDFKMGELFGLI